MKKQLFIILAICLAYVQGIAQDATYTQIYARKIYLSPAMTGMDGGAITMNYRNQWQGIGTPFRQFYAAVEFPISFSGRSIEGMGIQIQNDESGTGALTKTDFLLSYAHGFYLNQSETQILSFGLSAGGQQVAFNPSKVTFADQLTARDGFVGPTSEQFTGPVNQFRPDVNAGVAFFSPNFWIGASAMHITQPMEKLLDTPVIPGTTVDRPLSMTLFTGLKWEWDAKSRNGKNYGISATFMARKQREFSQLLAGLYLDLDPMVFGLWYRHEDALAGLIGLNAGPMLIGYSYDYTISRYSNNESGGSHELSLRLNLPERNNKRKKRRTSCPNF